MFLHGKTIASTAIRWVHGYTTLHMHALSSLHGARYNNKSKILRYGRCWQFLLRKSEEPYNDLHKQHKKYHHSSLF